MTNAEKLARIQKWIGRNTWGDIIGTENWSASSGPQPLAWYASIIKAYGTDKPDLVYIKVSEGSIDFTGGQFPEIRTLFLHAGIGCAPYSFVRPQFLSYDLEFVAKYGPLAGGYVLDAEDPFVGYDSSLVALVAGARHALGADPVLLVTGYADPVTAVPGWDFAAIAPADGYQPQFYTTAWGITPTRPWKWWINWSDGQLYQKFLSSGIGTDFPISPLCDIRSQDTIITTLELFQQTEYLLQRFMAGVGVWEHQDCNQTYRTYLRNACQQVQLQDQGK